MLGRLVKLSTIQSFFLFGARGTGKTSLVKAQFGQNSHYIDLLNLDIEARYQLDPERLHRELLALPGDVTSVIIDEIQKVPKLLDVVHRLIETTGLRFILTGSSARKLRMGGANLLAGRAVVFHLFPFLAAELGDAFQLQEALEFGLLPRIVGLADPQERRRSLSAYANTYLKEEVWGEQLVRKIEPFRRFLQVAAQLHGKILNFSKISRDVGVDDSTIRSYYSVLEDTLVGFFLPAYAGSERKKLRTAPKFYLFDNGVKRALEGVLDFSVAPASYEYGVLFEQLVISEIMRRYAYAEKTASFSFLATEGGREVDLVIERGRQVQALIEIKSGKKVNSEDLRHLDALASSFPSARCLCLYGGENSERFGSIEVLPWRTGIDALLSVE